MEKNLRAVWANKHGKKGRGPIERDEINAWGALEYLLDVVTYPKVKNPGVGVGRCGGRKKWGGAGGGRKRGRQEIQKIKREKIYIYFHLINKTPTNIVDNTATSFDNTACK